MVSLRNYYPEINLKFTIFLKIFTFIFLIWTYISYNSMVQPRHILVDDIFPKSLENKNEHGKILNREIHRLLAKDELHRELGHVGTGAKLFYDSVDKSKRNKADDISNFSQLNKKGSNKIDAYMKNYKSRYEKKKGLYKLDCYCENKVFDKLNYIYTLSDKMRNDKKEFKNKIRKKYGIVLIILSLIPALGLIYYILFGYSKELKGAIELCAKRNHYNGSEHIKNECTAMFTKDWKTTLENIEIFNEIFSFTMITIVLLFFIYIFIKVIKYKKLKAGRDKMSLKEYYRFTKSLL